MEGTLSHHSDKLKNIVILGAGNVASHLALSLSRHFRILQIYNRTAEHASAIADCTGAEAIDSLDDLSREADLYIISVSDDAIAPLARKLEGFGGTWVHTSGSVAMDALLPIASDIGVFYPMQTFTRGVEVDMRKVPFFLEAANDTVFHLLETAAYKLSYKVYRISSEQRMRLHIAAVFACNFTDYLWIHSSDILESIGADFSVMGSLIEATLDKALKYGPKNALTGPARRGDTNIIKKHLDVLEGESKAEYSLLSENILKLFNHEQNQL